MSRDWAGQFSTAFQASQGLFVAIYRQDLHHVKIFLRKKSHLKVHLKYPNTLAESKKIDRIYSASDFQ